MESNLLSRFSTILFLFLIISEGYSQCTIKGKVADEKSIPLVGVNVYIKGTYTGTSTDANGTFTLKTDLTGKHVIIAQMIGFEPCEQEVLLQEGEVKISCILEEEAIGLAAVTIVAGAFEAGDKIKSEVLQPMDIALTASSSADIYGALATLPGVQLVGEEGKLFVRGGESYETKTFIDGLLVETPYSNTMQNIPSRSKFSPLLFSGTMFSTGGYSAEYGQALSSALILSTKEMPSKNITNLNFFSSGMGFSHTRKFDNSAIIISNDYGNLGPYFKAVEQNMDWIKAPESNFCTINFFHKTKKSSMFKTLFSYTYDDSELYYPYYRTNNTHIPLALKNNSFLLDNLYKGQIGENTYIKAGIGINHDVNGIMVNGIDLTDRLTSGQLKVTIKHEISEKFKLSYGTDVFYKDFEELIDTNNMSFKMSYTDEQAALFTETELSLFKGLALRIGARAEYSSVIESATIMPRFSCAYKFKRLGQLSFAYGIFYQNPESEYLKFTQNLLPERAHHYILNYQYSKNKRVFRVEGFYKKYDDLIKYNIENDPDPDSYSNSGDGYAQGFDLFFRDRLSIRKGDYWISYSYLDTERNYKYYPIAATPKYFAKHNLTFVYKQWISALKSNVGLTYYYSSGRPYYDPNKPVNSFMTDRTKPYHDISINYAFDFSSFTKVPLTLFFSVSNLLGSDHVYGYRYVTPSDINQPYELYPVNSLSKRFYIIAILLSFSK